MHRSTAHSTAPLQRTRQMNSDPAGDFSTVRNPERRMIRDCAIWFTGLSGAGKTTLNRAVREQLEASGYIVESLDGDVVRQNLCRDLGFSKQDRDENVRRIG